MTFENIEIDNTLADISLEKSGIKSYQMEEKEVFMNAKMKKHFHDILSCIKHKLQEQVDNTVKFLKDEGGSHMPDIQDRATLETDMQLELRTRDRERKLIRRINNSLQSIQDGDYGYCKNCDNEINIRRLEARPIANLCIDCKTAEESK